MPASISARVAPTAIVIPMRAPPNANEYRRLRPPLTRAERLAGLTFLAGLVGPLALTAAVLVQPSLIREFDPYLPPVALLGLLATVGGVWWLWWRPR